MPKFIKTTGGKTLILPDISWVKDGEKQAIIEDKAVAFHKNWRRIKEARKLKKPKDINKEAWRDIKKLKKNKDFVKWLKRVEDAGYDITTCTEDDMRAFLTEYIDQSNIKKTKTIKSTITILRSAFRTMGRERHFGTKDSPVVFRGKTYIHTGNPMTESLQKELVNNLIEAVSTKRKRDATDSDEDEPGGGATGAATAATVIDPEQAERMGFPMSVAAAYVIMIHFLAEAMEMYVRFQKGELHSTAQIVNLFNLVLMYMFCLHEGTRPGDVSRNFKHSEISIIGNEVVYGLTLAILKPQTYRYLIEGNVLTTFKIGCYKGKTQGDVLERVKRVIPTPYNSLDFVHIYVIIMRALISLVPEQVFKRQRVFKPKLNLTSLRARKCHHTKLNNATFYSLRYGGAEDDEKAHIPEEWTRRRMGHTPISNMKDEYAKNKAARATFDGQDLALGMDHITDDACVTIPLHFTPVDQGGLVFQPQWLDTLFAGEADEGVRADFIEDFTQCHELVKSWIEGESPDESKADLLTRVTNRDINPISWHKQIPFGAHIIIPTALCPEGLRQMYDNAVECLESIFRAVEVPNRVPELYSFPQVFYGDWQVLIGRSSSANTYIHKVDAEDDVARSEVAPGVAPRAPPKKKRRKQQSAVVDAVEPAPIVDDYIEDIEYRYDTIEVGDTVVILCRQPKDKAALRIGEKFVWLVTVQKHTEFHDGSYEIKGKFLFNPEKDITLPLTKSVVDRVVCRHVKDVIEVYAAEDEFVLTDDDITKLSDLLGDA
jgi:hypothetical protein